MILMLCVLMMVVTNASNERIKKGKQDEEMNVSSERPILKSQFQKNRLLQVCAFQSSFDFPRHITKIIFSYLIFAPVTTKLFSHKINDGVISRDGHFLLTCEGSQFAHSRRKLHLSDLTSGERVRTFTVTASDPDPNVRLLSYAIANNRSFVAGACDPNIYLWNTYSGKLMTILVGQWKINFCCIFLNDTRITTGGFNDVRVWEVNLETNQFSCLYVLPGYPINLLVSADSAHIITGVYNDTRIRVWNSVTGEFLQVLEGYANHSLNSCAMSVDNDQCLGSIDVRSREIKLWNVTTGECTKTIAGSEPQFFYICYLSSKRLVQWGRREVSVWDLQTDTIIYTLSFEKEIKFISVSADGNKAVHRDTFFIYLILLVE